MKQLMPPIDTSSDNTFHDGNPLTGELGTMVSALFMNNLQGVVRNLQTELINVMKEADVDVDESNENQVLSALQKLFLTQSLKSLGTEDLNTIITPGRKFQSVNANATVERNYPVSQSGMLDVIKTSDNGIRQVYYPFNSTNEYHRFCEDVTTNQLDFSGWSEPSDYVLEHLSSGSGDNLLGTRGGITLRQRNDVMHDIRDYGGVDDWDGVSGTDSTAALLSAVAIRPVTVRFPKTAEGTGKYYFAGSTDLNMVGVTFHVDAGVSFVQPSDNKNSPVRKWGSRANRRIDIEVLGGSKFTHGLGASLWLDQTEKGFIGSPDDGDIYLPKKLGFNSDTAQFAYLPQGTWPNGTLTFDSTGFTVADNIVQFLPGENTFRGVLFPIVVGDTLMASVRDGGEQIGVWVETVNGWCVVRNSPSPVNTFSVQKKEGGQSTGYNLSRSQYATDPWRFNYAMSGIVLLGPQTFGVILNGVIVARVDTASPVISAGWVNGYSDTVTATISDPILIRNKTQHGLPLLKIVGIGDSTSDHTVTIQSQFEYAAQWLAGVGGAQVLDVKNLAVGGHASKNQKDILLATNISGYDLCLIQIGINDIQGAVGPGVFAQNVSDMIDYCRENGVEPIVGVPAMFYTRADITSAGISTDHIGQNSSNSRAGTLYRLNLLRMLSEKKCFCCTMSYESLGVVSPALLGVASTDKIMMDNIHPTVFGSSLMGLAWAKAIAAYFTKANTDGLRQSAGLVSVESFGVARLPGRYFIDGIADTQWLRYTVDPTGRRIRFYYYVSKAASLTLTSDHVIGVLPARLRPAAHTVMVVQPRGGAIETPVGSPVTIIINREGQIRVFGATDPSITYIPIEVEYDI